MEQNLTEAKTSKIAAFFMALKKNPIKTIIALVSAIVAAFTGFSTLVPKTEVSDPIPAIYQQVIVDVGSSGIIASIGTADKKQFLTGVDSENRYLKFASLGLKTQYTVTLTGQLDTNRLNAAAVGYVQERAANPIEKPEYYAVSIGVKLQVAENAKHIFISDSLGSRYLTDQIINGYLNTTTYYAIADTDRNWSICGETQANGVSDGYIYYEVQDENYNVINSFFYHVIYNLTFLTAGVNV